MKILQFGAITPLPNGALNFSGFSLEQTAGDRTPPQVALMFALSIRMLECAYEEMQATYPPLAEPPPKEVAT